MISSALAASGLVSMAVTKMARGWNPRPAPLLNGRVRSAVHWPDATRISTLLRSSCASSAEAKCSKLTCSSDPSMSMTTDWRTRLAPRLISRNHTGGRGREFNAGILLIFEELLTFNDAITYFDKHSRDASPRTLRRV